eukprot:7548128-Pyramimonas_sp.AAC.1
MHRRPDAAAPHHATNNHRKALTMPPGAQPKRITAPPAPIQRLGSTAHLARHPGTMAEVAAGRWDR